ncbi:hypothetical protein KCU81_g9246, partial [Aureobasidium melanogenum]|uniref:DUF7029 domain-containing protein n=1 Tax=Aureobasidium melanogenum (strain CBS 110374) TaxID=1043003 RepID=A0A074VCI4_AURM1
MTMRLPVLILTMAAAAAASALSDSNATSTADTSSVAALASEQTATTVVLGAVSTPASDASASITPSASVSLSYVSPSNDTGSAQAAQVDLDMKYPTVVLENINDLDTVDCSDGYMLLAFNSTNAYEGALNEWSAHQEIVFITNHLGNCDAELERGFFLAGSFTAAQDSTPIINATIAKQDLSETANTASISLGRSQASVSRRGLTEAVPVSYALDLFNLSKTDIALASVPNVLDLTINKVNAESDISLIGSIVFDFNKFTFSTVVFDINYDLSAYLSATVEVTSSYQNTLSTKPAISINPISIAGILEFQPALQFALGAEIVATGNISAVSETSFDLSDATIHIDALTPANSYSGKWSPTFQNTFNSSENFDLIFNPSISADLSLDVLLLGIWSIESVGLVGAFDFGNDLSLKSSNSTCEVSLTQEVDFTLDLDFDDLVIDLYKYDSGLIQSCL